MRPEEDLAAYVAARRPLLQDVLDQLGCPRELIPGVVADAVRHCRSGWAATLHHDDVDVVVLAALLTAWTERRRTDWWSGLSAPEEAEDAHPELDRLPPRQRAARVLTDVAGLSGDRVEDVLDRELDARRRRPAIRVVVAGAVALALVAGVATTLAVTGRERTADPDALPAVPAQEAEGLVDAIWWTAGLLRLRDATVAIGSLRQLVEVPGGGIYVAGDGQVVRVESDGDRTALGRADPSAPLVGSRDGLLVAWREFGGDLVLHDVVAGSEVGRVTGIDLAPVAVDDGRLYFDEPGGSGAFRPGEPPVHVSGLPLLDVRSGTRLFRVGPGHVRLDPPAPRSDLIGIGRSGSLSPDGRFALVSTGTGVVAYDSLGGSVTAGVAADERLIAGTFGRDGTVVLVVAVPERAADDDEFGRRSAAGSWELRTCVLGTGACVVESVLSAGGDVPVFAS